MKDGPMPYFFILKDSEMEDDVVLMDTPSQSFMEDAEKDENLEVRIITCGVDGLVDDPEFAEHVVVPKVLLYQAISIMSYDAKAGYSTNLTSYADRRHGTSRSLADYVGRDYTDFPDTGEYFPPSLWDGVDEVEVEEA